LRIIPIGNTGKSGLVSSQSNCAIHQNKLLPNNKTRYLLYDCPFSREKAASHVGENIQCSSKSSLYNHIVNANILIDYDWVLNETMYG
jgi:hypothetical protein